METEPILPNLAHSEGKLHRCFPDITGGQGIPDNCPRAMPANFWLVVPAQPVDAKPSSALEGKSGSLTAQRARRLGMTNLVVGALRHSGAKWGDRRRRRSPQRNKIAKRMCRRGRGL